MKNNKNKNITAQIGNCTHWNGFVIVIISSTAADNKTQTESKLQTQRKAHGLCARESRGEGGGEGSTLKICNNEKT